MERNTQLGILYVIGTPIGNLGDITLRAIEILKKVDAVLCEDTRVTSKLLKKYNITVPTISYHAHSGETKVEKALAMLADGKTLALVSDAGTPGISDPGSVLVARAREEEIKIETVPGPSALAAAISIAGLPAHEFLFLGFLPHKKGRETLTKEIAATKRAVIFYESPHRVQKIVSALAKLAPERNIGIARELTKIYESFEKGTSVEIAAKLASGTIPTKGEFVVIVYPSY